MKMKENHYSLTISSQLTQKKLERVGKDFKETETLIESLGDAAEARKSSEGGKEEG